MAKKYDLEILAPAGSYDIFTAAIAAGADAVYLGGDMFGARAFAGNFGKEELIRALDYAHIRDKKIYLTVNTLLKEQELSGMLVDYIAPYYEAGLDAAIVQDMGVFKTLHDNFPDLPLHASTQMTVTGSEGAAILKKMGASRVVTARELSLEEIRKIYDTCDIEIESFVHGALCYCYSGQCLFSSMNGARSGNRGRCAQPCRLAYEVLDKSGKTVNSKNEAYGLSPKDMCALDILPDIAEAGVYSLKIEGRMKNVTYAAGVTSIYRKYVDMLNERGREGYKVAKQDISDLMDMYNRGAFTSGYYNNSKGKSMMSLSRPNHMGIKALEVVDNVSGRVTFKALVEINRQDVFEIDGENSFASGEDVRTGGRFVVNLPRKYNLPKGRVLFRTRNNKITQNVVDRFVEKSYKTQVDLSLFAEVGEPLKLMAETYFDSIDEQFSVVVSGNEVQSAMKQPASKEKVAEQISKLGNTDYVAKDVCVELSGDVFIPVGELNDIRRKAVEALTDEILAYFKRAGNKVSEQPELSVKPELSAQTVVGSQGFRKSVLVNEFSEFTMALEDSQITDVYLDFGLLDEIYDSKCGTVAVAGCGYDVPNGTNVATLQTNKQIILALPHILRGKNDDKCKMLIEKAVELNIDTFLIRNLEELGLVATFFAKHNCGTGNESESSKAKVVIDANMYCWNSMSLKQYMEIVDKLNLELIRVTMPYELKKEEMATVCRKFREDAIATKGKVPEVELIVRSQIPLMVSEQCVRRTYGMCDKSNGIIYIKDKKGQVNKVQSVCDYCYSVIYSDIYDVTKQLSDSFIEELAPDVVRYELEADKTGKCFDGHFNVGVE